MTVTCKEGMKVISLWDKESGSYAIWQKSLHTLYSTIYHIHLRADHIHSNNLSIFVLVLECSFFYRVALVAQKGIGKGNGSGFGSGLGS